MTEVVIGSRGSPLALWQSQYVQQEIEKRRPDLKVHVQVIKTSGDRISKAALAKAAAGTGVKGLFVKEIEEALHRGRIDLAVHSLKDLPTQLPMGLCLSAVPERADPRDVLVAERKLSSLDELPQGARLGTGSLRRTVQLRFLRPDLEIIPVGGNVETRIRKMREKGLDGVVLAAAGLKRLGLDEKIAYVFSIDEMIPAISQGALAVEARTNDEWIHNIVAPLDHEQTRRCTGAERLFLQRMGGGCQVPMGAYARIAEDGQASFAAFVAGPESGRLIRKVTGGPAQELERLALETAEELGSRPEPQACI